ncbi:MAG: hypothetical protein RI564_12740, partial [Gracilimonas sp.]|nr:hypothetical protein [Gracilimonas sp.]
MSFELTLVPRALPRNALPEAPPPPILITSTTYSPSPNRFKVINKKNILLQELNYRRSKIYVPLHIICVS